MPRRNLVPLVLLAVLALLTAGFAALGVSAAPPTGSVIVQNATAQTLGSPLGTTSYIIRLITLRPILNELAWTEQLPELAHLLRREDIPRAPQRLPRPLTAEQDQLLQQEFLRRNDLGGNVFLLMCHTGMRSGNVPISPSIACAPPARINGRFMCRSANSKQNGWSL